MEPDVEALPMSATDIRSPPTTYISPLIHNIGLRYRRTPTAESDEHSIERNVRHSRKITCNAVQSENTLRPDPTENFYDNIRKDITNSGAEYCIFIAVSTGRSFRIVSVPVKNPKNDVVTWKRIQECYYEATGLWRKYNPFHGVTKVSEAKFRFEGNYAGKNFANVQIPCEAEIDNEFEKLQRKIEKNKLGVAALEDWETVEICVPCGVNPVTGRYQHENSDCPTLLDTGECPYQSSDDLNDRYQRLCSLSLLTSCFHKPDLATEQQTFTGFFMDENLIYYYKDIKPSSQYKARIGGTEFLALHIQEGFLYSLEPNPLIPTIFAIVAILIWGLFTMDWKSTSQMVLTVITTVISNLRTGQPGKG